MTFNLFDNEEKIIEQSSRVLNDVRFGNPEAQRAYEKLLDAYKKGLREQRRMVRISDRLQEQMSALNQELERRRVEAERALNQLRETQENLIQAEKLASLGGLVAGIAHEINTPIGITLTAASHLNDQIERLQSLYNDNQLRKNDFRDFLLIAIEAAQLILSNSQRAAQLIHGFKQVAVDQTSAERRRFLLKPYLKEILFSLSPRLKHTEHHIVVHCPDDIELDGFPGALSQIITNLVMNSLQHAYEEGQAGEISVKVTALSQDIIEIQYKDNGRGVPEKNLSRIFDPFFTTGRGSGGAGLGLHIVFNLVTGTLKGQVTVESTEGCGVLFVITFPREIHT
ncbi:Histidine kinase [Azospirillaceae bacterium]